jgi:hypothetical protein
MRIIIEIDKDGLPVQVQAEADASATLVSDGGSPQGILPDAQEDRPSDSDPKRAKSAGGPPDWLVQAIESAMLAEAAGDQEAGSDSGGAAPA